MQISPTIRYLVKSVALGIGVAGTMLWLFPELSNNSETIISAKRNAAPLSYAEAARNAGPAVVNIYTRSYQNSNVRTDNELRPANLGSGVIMSDKGYILTNYHVVTNADQIIVALQDGRVLTADLIGSDIPTDLAVLRISADNIPVIPQDERITPQVGDVVLAIGNPYNVGQTITQGIISATGRNGLSTMGPDSNGRQDLLQTDAAINTGNSGGALVNTNGELVGINSASYQVNSSDNLSSGIGFAIPYRLAHRIMQDLIAHGRVLRGYLGISTVEIDVVTAKLLNLGELRGLVIENVDPNGPGAKAGLQRGDILTKIDDKAVSGVRSAMDIIAETKPGTKIPLFFIRQGKQEKVQIEVEEDLRFKNYRQ